MFKFTINSTEVSQGIENWTDLKISVIRDYTNRIVRLDMPQEMTFTGECYEIIKNKFDANGYCGILEVQISKEVSNNSISYKQFFDGLIFINECEFNNFQKNVIVPIRDNSFISKINNNRLVQFYTETDITKNGVSITAIAPIYSSMYNPANGVVNNGFTYAGDRQGYDWLELINACVRFITDDEITVVSDWYTNLDDAEKIMIMQGYELRTADGTNEQFFTSFDVLTKDIFKGYNLWMSIDGSTLRIEEESYYYNTDELFTLNEIVDVKESFNQFTFYSNVSLGSAESIKTGSFPIGKGVAFISENYFFGGECNILNQLELNFTNLITDGNLIQDILLNDTDTYDDNLFIIQYTASTGAATKGQLPFGSPRFYNLVWTNLEVFNRYQLAFGGFSVLDSLQDKFRATSTLDGVLNGTNYGFQTFVSQDVPTVSFSLIFTTSLYDDSTSPNFDNNNRFFPNTNLYNVNQTGYYSFYYRIRFQIQNLVITSTSGNNRLQVYQVAFTNPVLISSFTLLKDVNNNSIDFVFADGIYEYEGQVDDVFLVAGDTFNFPTSVLGQTVPFVAGVEEINGDIKFLSNSYVECVKTPTSGGQYGSNNPDIFKVSLFTFEKKMTQSQVDLLLDTPYKAFNFNQDGVNNKKVWANEISINLLDNTANIEAISDIENSG